MKTYKVTDRTAATLIGCLQDFNELSAIAFSAMADNFGENHPFTDDFAESVTNFQRAMEKYIGVAISQSISLKNGEIIEL